MWFRVTRANAQKSPEYEGVREAGQGPFADDFGLAEHFPEEVPDALADGRQAEVRVFSGFEDSLENGREAAPEQGGGSNDQSRQKQLLPRREAMRFSKRGGEDVHIRTHSQYTIRPLIGRSRGQQV